MTKDTLAIGFIPLVDAAPLVVAHEMGFAADEGLSLDLRRSSNWSALRDVLSVGQVQAAHMLAPVPVAAALGLGGAMTPLEAIATLSVNGTVIGVSGALADRMRAQGHDFDFQDASRAGRALIAAKGETLRIGVPFPFSMHAELVFYWLTALGLPAPQGVDVRTVPPPLMADALGSGEIDAFCVGEPWGSRVIEDGVGALLLPGAAIWAFAPEKVLAVSTAWRSQNEDLAHRLIRALWRAARWLETGGAQGLTAEVLSRPGYLDLPAELIERALVHRLDITVDGEQRDAPAFIEFHKGAAGFPWRSHADWIAQQMAGRLGLNKDEAGRTARAVFRTDIYRAALAGTEADLPAASAKVEGAIDHQTAVGSGGGGLFLPRDQFFDGRIFVPSPLG